MSELEQRLSELCTIVTNNQDIGFDKVQKQLESLEKNQDIGFDKVQKQLESLEKRMDLVEQAAQEKSGRAMVNELKAMSKNIGRQVNQDVPLLMCFVIDVILCHSWSKYMQSNWIYNQNCFLVKTLDLSDQKFELVHSVLKKINTYMEANWLKILICESKLSELEKQISDLKEEALRTTDFEEGVNAILGSGDGWKPKAFRGYSLYSEMIGFGA